MWWMAAFAAAKGIEDGRLAKGQAKIDKLTMKSNVALENKRREANNILAKAQGDLNRFQQSRSNKYKLEQGGQAAEAQTINMLRLSDQAVRGSFEGRIAASEVAGALAASAGFAGIGGGSLAMLNATNTLRQQRAQQQADTQTDTQLYDMGLNLDRTREATILGLDDIRFFDNINYMTAQETHISEPSWLSIAGNAAMTFAQSYSQMGGFDGWGTKMKDMMSPAPSGSNAAGYSQAMLSGWGGVTTQLK